MAGPTRAGPAGNSMDTPRLELRPSASMSALSLSSGSSCISISGLLPPLARGPPDPVITFEGLFLKLRFWVATTDWLRPGEVTTRPHHQELEGGEDVEDGHGKPVALLPVDPDGVVEEVDDQEDHHVHPGDDGLGD